MADLYADIPGARADESRAPRKRYRDMGDGTYAEVVAVDGIEIPAPPAPEGGATEAKQDDIIEALEGTLTVGGGVNANATDTQQPVKVGARYDASLPTYDNGDLTNLQADANGRLHVGGSLLTEIAENTRLFSPVYGETVAIGNTADESNSLPAGRVWLRGTVPFHFLVGASPTADTSSPYVPAGESVYVRVQAGWAVSVIRATGDDGTLYVSTEEAPA